MLVGFDDVIAWTPAGGATWTTTLPSEWMQGRGSFGGIVAAAALKAMRSLLAPERTPRTVTTTFLGPVTAAPATMSARILREGRSVSFVEAEIVQEGTLRLRAMGAFGAARESILSAPRPPLEVPPLEGTFHLRHISGLIPDFIQMCDVRYTEGSFPFTGVRDGVVIGALLRFSAPATRGYERLLGLLDVLPAPVLQQLDRPAAASSVQWTSHFVAPDTTPPDARNYLRYETVSAGDGYSTAIGTLYDHEGRVVAWQEQLHAIFG